MARGAFGEAEDAYRRVLSSQRVTYSEPHSSIALTLNNLGAAKRLQLDHAGSEVLFREALAMRRAVFGDQHPHIAESLVGLGASLRSQGRSEFAEAPLAEALSMQRKMLPPAHPTIGGTLFHLASASLEVGNFAACESRAQEGVEVLERTFESPNWQLARTRSVLGGCLAGQGFRKEAEALLLESLPVLEQARGLQALETLATRHRLVDLYVSWGKHESARAFQ